MSDNTMLAEAINLPKGPAVVILTPDKYQELLQRIDCLETNQEILFGLIAKLKKISANPGKKSDRRKKALANILASRKNVGLTYAEIGKLLELGTRKGNASTREQNMTHFGKLLETSTDEFIVTSGKTRGGKLVKLTDAYYEHLLRGDGS
ncbi:MAG: hypothetical protein AB9879_09935 [Methanothrix sp.]